MRLPPPSSRRHVAAWTLPWALLATAAVLPPPAARAALPPPGGQPRFVVETDCPPAQRAFLNARLGPFASAADVLLAALTGASPPPRSVRLRVFCERARYTAFARAHAPRRARNGGYFDAATRTVVTYRRGNPPQILLHEVAHALLRDAWAGAAPAPPWLDEGLAEYLSSYATETPGTADSPNAAPPRGTADGVRFGAPNPARLTTLLDARARGLWLPVSALVAAPPAAFTGPDMGRYYAAAWGLVDLLVGDPALRARFPALVTALRAGRTSAEALDAIYGPRAPTDLDRRLRALVAARGARWARDARPIALSTAPLGEWTEHGHGRWASSPHAALAGDTLTGESPDTWSYLTRAIPPQRALVLTGEIRRDAGAVGLALGSHRARGYAYHTLVELGPETLSVLHAASRQTVEPLARARVASPAGTWVSLRVELAGGTLAVWRGGALVLTLRLPTSEAGGRAEPRLTPESPWVSLVGVYVREGRGAFRGLRLDTPTPPHRPPPRQAHASAAADSNPPPDPEPPPALGFGFGSRVWAASDCTSGCSTWRGHASAPSRLLPCPNATSCASVRRAGGGSGPEGLP